MHKIAMTTTLQTFVVLGAGAWGSALALHLARAGHQVKLWGHDAAHLQRIINDKKNLVSLGDFSFPENIEVIFDLSEALKQDVPYFVLIAIPSHAVESLLDKLLPALSRIEGIVVASKGLTQHGELLCRVIERQLPNVPYGLLSGPSFAKEVAAGLPTAITFASLIPGFSQMMVDAFHQENFRVYQSQDMVGVSLGGCLKNVLAIAVGISDGLNFGANARAALITRGLAEIMRLGHQLGAQTQTLVGLAGLGDLVLTCTDDQSRNRRFGLALGKGQTIEAAYQSIQQAVEGYTNAKQVFDLAKQHQVSLPICEAVYRVLYEQQSPSDALLDLTRRPPKSEMS